MPLTTLGDEEERRRHIWHSRALNNYDSTKVKSICGEVHVSVGTTTLVAVKEATEAESLEGWLETADTCPECEDRLRDELGLDPRALEAVSGVGQHKAAALRRQGYNDVSDLRYATQEGLSKVPEIGNALAARIKADVGGEEDR